MFTKVRTICAAMCVGILCASVSGCALFGSELDKAAEAAGKLVTFYCENIPNEAVREQFRTAVNEHAAPNAVNVTCANGSAPLAAPSTPTGATVMPTTNEHEKKRVADREAHIAKHRAAVEAERSKNPPPNFDALFARVAALESSNGAHETRLASLESSSGAHANRLASLDTATSDHASRITSLERRNG